MRKHIHRPIEGTVRNLDSGAPIPPCAKQDKGKACSNAGSHWTVQCRCGAVGVGCSDHAKLHWISAT